MCRGTSCCPTRRLKPQASKDPSTLRVFDDSKVPLVTGGTYASAEDLCNKHFTN